MGLTLYDSSGRALTAEPTASNAVVVLSQTDPAFSLASSTTETQTWTYSLPADTLNATDYLRINIAMWVLNNTGGAVTHDHRFKIDGATIATITPNLGSGAAYTMQFVQVHIWPYSTSNSEVWVRHERNGTVATFVVNDALAFDTTASRTLSHTIQLGSSSASHAAKLKNVTVELLKAA